MRIVPGRRRWLVTRQHHLQPKTRSRRSGTLEANLTAPAKISGYEGRCGRRPDSGSTTPPAQHRHIVQLADHIQFPAMVSEAKLPVPAPDQLTEGREDLLGLQTLDSPRVDSTLGVRKDSCETPQPAMWV